MTTLQEKVDQLPTEPGVYFFLAKRKILYIGKATGLRTRVRSYFDKRIAVKRSTLIARLMEEADDIDFRVTPSVLEATILEANLIKRHLPFYNSAQKDDKTYSYIIITSDDYPRILIVRESDLSRYDNPKHVFGPYPKSGDLKTIYRILRKVFPFRDAKCRIGTRPCFNYQIGLCPGTCTGRITKLDYARTIRNIVYVFSGKTKLLSRTLKREMTSFAKAQEFEKANRAKRELFAIQHINDVALLTSDTTNDDGTKAFRIEAYDVAHLSGKDMVGVGVSVRNGLPEKRLYRKYIIRGQSKSDDIRALAQVLERRMKHRDWPLPDLIVVDGSTAQYNSARQVVSRYCDIPIVAVTKDEHHRPCEIKWFGEHRDSTLEDDILLANAEAHRFAITFHKARRNSNFLPKREVR